MFLKVIVCEIAARELYYTAARSPQLVDLEFLTQGHHDTPATGRTEIQERIEGCLRESGAILLGYGLCSNILVGFSTPHTQSFLARTTASSCF